MYSYICICVCMCVCVCVCVCLVCACVCACFVRACVYTYVYIYMRSCWALRRAFCAENVSSMSSEQRTRDELVELTHAEECCSVLQCVAVC